VRAEAQVASLCGALGLALLLGACEGPSSTPAASGSAAPPSADAADPLAPLRAHEATLRGGIDFTHRPPWDHATGPNPSALAPLPSGKGFVGLLRGADALVLLGPDGKERRRYPAPPSPTALAVGPDGAIFVGGQASGRIQRFREVADELSLEGELTLPEALSVRTLAVGPKGTLYVADFEGGRVLAVAPETRATEGRLGAKPLGERRCHGPLRLAVAERRLLVDCLLDHAVVVVNLGEDGALQKGGEAEIRHDGPLWSMAVAPTKDGLLVALGGIEDQPLDRSQGAFGFIDSFLFLYLVRGDDADLVRLANLSQLDVVTPKWLDLEVSPAEVSVAVTGYGGETMVTLHYPPEVHGALRVDKRTLPPGTVAAARLPGGERLFANALLDAWVSEADSALTPVEPAQGGAPAHAHGLARRGVVVHDAHGAVQQNRRPAQQIHLRSVSLRGVRGRPHPLDRPWQTSGRRPSRSSGSATIGRTSPVRSTPTSPPSRRTSSTSPGERAARTLTSR
jgi:hypothetical protein